MLKLELFRPPTQNQITFDAHNKAIFGPHTEIKSISTTHTQTELFDPTPPKTFFSASTRKPSRFQWIHARKSSHFFHAHKKEVNFHPPKQKPSQFRSTQNNQVDLDCHPKTKSTPIPALKQLNFDLPHN